MTRFVTVTVGLSLVAAAGRGQAQPTRIGFEVASIKPTEPGGTQPIAGVKVRGGCYGGPGSRDSGRVHCGEITVPRMICFAYDLALYEIEYPKALDNLKFEVLATVPEGSAKSHVPLMLQTLLAERFKLKFHTEQKKISGYELTVAKGGLKVQKTGEAADQSGSAGFAHRTAEGSWTWGGSKQSMESLARLIASRLGLPVNDATGLKGLYGMTLTWAEPEIRLAPLDNLSPPAALSLALSSESGPTIFDAVQQQLGLKLSSAKVGIKAFVIDQVEKTPSEN